MQFTTVVPTERIRLDDNGDAIRSPKGGFVKDRVPAGTVYEGANYIDHVITGLALPSDAEAKALCQEHGVDIKAAIKGRKILENTDLVKEIGA